MKEPDEIIRDIKKWGGVTKYTLHLSMLYSTH